MKQFILICAVTDIIATNPNEAIVKVEAEQELNETILSANQTFNLASVNVEAIDLKIGDLLTIEVRKVDGETEKIFADIKTAAAKLKAVAELEAAADPEDLSETVKAQTEAAAASNEAADQIIENQN